MLRTVVLEQQSQLISCRTIAPREPDLKCNIEQVRRSSIYLARFFTTFFCFSFLHPFFLEGCGGGSSSLRLHTSRYTNTRLHFSWIKFQTVPTKILDIIKPSCSWSSNWPLPLTVEYKVCLESRS